MELEKKKPFFSGTIPYAKAYGLVLPPQAGLLKMKTEIIKCIIDRLDINKTH